VKTIQKDKIKSDIEGIIRELKIMKSLDHPNIIKFYETYQDQKYFHLVMEYCKGGSLLDKQIEKGKFTEPYTAKIMEQIISVVEYLHFNGISHRDLKPDNFLFTNRKEDSEIRIIDFGLSIFAEDE
jgi:calcium-dependent protein kinase